MEAEIKYPIGIQDFEAVRQGNMVYVDKTSLIYKLVNTSTYVFLSRPRRFGKSLLTSTLRYYFEGRKDLFAGLAMEKLETKWESYSVLHSDLSDVKRNTPNALIAKLQDVIDMIEANHSIHTMGTPGDRLGKLIYHLYKKNEKKVVVLIDEYDAPIINILHKTDVLPEMREVMRDFYAPLKKFNEYLRFVFITGISTYSQMGIFSELNNLDVITNSNDYASLCGITTQELLENFKPGISTIAREKNTTEEFVLNRLKEKYDGYHFTSSMVDVYNPFSLIKALKDRDFGDYWFNTGTSAYLLEMLKRYKKRNPNFRIEDLGDSDWMAYSTFNKSLEISTSYIPLFYQSGYLTIKESDPLRSRFRLGIPNDEVRVGLLGDLLPLYADMDVEYAKNTVDSASILLQDGRIDEAMLVFKSLLADVPYMRNMANILADVQKTEMYYHSLFYLFFDLLHNGTEAEVRSARGAADVVIKTERYIYVIEIKINASANAALKQIDKKGYVTPFLASGKRVLKVGVRFSTKLRTLSDWRVVEV
jgi:hypothetical protein